MKPFVYFCILLFVNIDAMAQIDPYDNNWDTLVHDEFTNNSWNTWNEWKISHPKGYYKAFFWESGVTHGSAEHQVYQRDNVMFDNTGTFRLVSNYVGGTDTIPLACGDYDIPNGYSCDASLNELYFSSGAFETGPKYLYGYFEIKCSLPVHPGSFPAFWLYNRGNTFYNEIDIFEYSNSLNPQDPYRQFTCGLYCDNSHKAPDSLKKISQARVYPILPNGSNDLTHYHVFACEWLPERVTWYVDGDVVNEYTNYDSIPHHPMTLKVNYAINNHVLQSPYGKPKWIDGDEMDIDYLKVFQLKTNCDTDVLITNAQGLSNYQPSVKKSITITPTNMLTVPINSNINMRAVDSIVINKNFVLPQGAQITLQTQMCPE